MFITRIKRNIMTLCDVSMRDGIQSLRSPSEKPFLCLPKKYFFVDKLAQYGFDNIEIGSNVSKSVVEMTTTKDLIKMIHDKPINCNKMVLVPNYKKFKELLEMDIDAVNTISLITSCSESFTLKNTKMTIEQSLNEIQKIVETIKYLDNNPEFITKLNLRIYISCCFGCPIEKKFSQKYIDIVADIFKRFSYHSFVKEIVISDTNGTFDNYLFEDYLGYFGYSNKLSFHIHKNNPTLSWACKIIERSLNRTSSLDCSMGNVGGCSSLEKMPPNLPTVLMSKAYNIVSGEDKYNIAHLDELDKIFSSNLEN